jgi:hypothetical protein
MQECDDHVLCTREPELVVCNGMWLDTVYISWLMAPVSGVQW